MSWGETPKSTFAIEMEKRARQRAREEARQARASERSRTYTAADLARFYRVDEASGCWLWIGEFRRYGDGPREIPIEVGLGKHQMCGIAHNAMSRTIYEEYQGAKLKSTENVVGTCASNQGARHACVNPEHHELRRGAGLMFSHEMIE
jgi:hypothetical protein